MARRITSLFMAILLATGCFKTDIFDYDEKENFLTSDFYQSKLDDFELVIQDIQLFDPQPSPFGGTSYAYSITYGIEEDFYQDLRQNWDGEILLSRTVNTQLKLYQEHIVDDSARLFFTDTIGRKTFPFTSTIKVDLILKTIAKPRPVPFFFVVI